MKIDKITLKNFKGIREMTLSPMGKSLDIRGQNATCKTSIYDGYLWLLFDKDSSDRATFEIKTIDTTGGVIHNLEHEVSAVFDFDGPKVTLRKMLKEKWTKKKGALTPDFTGHETFYWVDELPVSKADYSKKIESIVPEELFKLLGNPLYFNESLKWQDRRKMLFDAFVKDEIDLFSMKPELSEIRAEIEKHGAENYKRITTEKRKLCNNELEQIPTRIDETTRSLPSLEGMNEAVSEKEKQLQKKAEIEIKLTELEHKKRDSDHAVIAFRNKTLELENLKNKIIAEAMKEYSEAKDVGTKLFYEIQEEKKTIKDLTEKIGERIGRITELEEKHGELIKKWKSINAEVFEVPDVHDFKCPTCRQQLPSDDIEQKIEELKSNFSKNKKEKLDDISKKGEENKKEKTERKSEIEEFEKQIEGLHESIKKKNEDMNRYVKLHEEGKNKQVDYESNENYKKLSAELDKLLTASFNDSDLVKLRTEIDMVNSTITELDKKVALKDIAEQARKRLEELHNRQRELSQEIAQIEKKEYLIDEYIKLKAKTVESSINKHFKIVRFKMFETQINGGVNEVCVATVNNVPYSDLNTAGKIQAGLDIIRAFAEVHSLKAPIFIDNAESIIDIPDTGAQQIRLYVFDTDKEENERHVERMMSVGKWQKNGRLYVEVK